MQEPTDENLMQRVAKGDHSALRGLMERHMQYGLALAERIAGGNQEADDICQEAFLRVWQRAALFDPERGSFKTWLYRMVVNLAIDRTRGSRARQEPIEEAGDVVSDEPAPEARLHARQQERDFERAFRSLPERQRAALALFHFDRLSGRDAAMALDLSEKAFGSLLTRARKTLRRRYEDIQAMGDQG